MFQFSVVPLSVAIWRRFDWSQSWGSLAQLGKSKFVPTLMTRLTFSSHDCIIVRYLDLLFCYASRSCLSFMHSTCLYTCSSRPLNSKLMSKLILIAC